MFFFFCIISVSNYHFNNLEFCYNTLRDVLDSPGDCCEEEENTELDWFIPESSIDAQKELTKPGLFPIPIIQLIIIILFPYIPYSLLRIVLNRYC